MSAHHQKKERGPSVSAHQQAEALTCSHTYMQHTSASYWNVCFGRRWSLKISVEIVFPQMEAFLDSVFYIRLQEPGGVWAEGDRPYSAFPPHTGGGGGQPYWPSGWDWRDGRWSRACRGRVTHTDTDTDTAGAHTHTPPHPHPHPHTHPHTHRHIHIFPHGSEARMMLLLPHECQALVL